jgi:hypothetical protein
VYVADPFESAREGFSLVPSTARLSVPVGVVSSELDAEATVIVTVSFAPDAGEVVAAERVVSDASNDDDVVVGHAVRRL